MAEKKQTIVESFKNLFGKKKGLDDLKMDELNRERIRLEQEERKMLAEIQKLESDKRKLFEDGTRKTSELEQRVLARSIQELDHKARERERNLQAISKQKRIIGGLIEVKERMRVMSESGISAVLKNIDMGDLLTYVDKASVDGEFHMDKFNEMLRTLGQADNIRPEITEDQDVLDIVKEMQLARAAADQPEAVEEHYAEVNRKMGAKEGETESND
jgi:hypothetical protein